jgi:hypothetical protein
MRKLLTYLTRGASGDPQAMCDMILQVYRWIGIYTLV